MQYNPTSIITGVFVLFLVAFILISFFTFIYVGFTKKKHDTKAPRIFLATALVSLAWVVSTLLSIVFASSYGTLVFAAFSLLFIFGASYFFAHKTLGFTGRDKIIYAAMAAIIFNPAWLTVVGIL